MIVNQTDFTTILFELSWNDQYTACCFSKRWQLVFFPFLYQCFQGVSQFLPCTTLKTCKYFNAFLIIATENRKMVEGGKRICLTHI